MIFSLPNIRYGEKQVEDGIKSDGTRYRIETRQHKMEQKTKTGTHRVEQQYKIEKESKNGMYETKQQYKIEEENKNGVYGTKQQFKIENETKIGMNQMNLHYVEEESWMGIYRRKHQYVEEEETKTRTCQIKTQYSTVGISLSGFVGSVVTGLLEPQVWKEPLVSIECQDEPQFEFGE